MYGGCGTNVVDHAIHRHRIYKYSKTDRGLRPLPQLLMICWYRVLSCKDFYEVLMVSRDATEVELKKQYKRLALTLHPDKNRAPQADEAFKCMYVSQG